MKARRGPAGILSLSVCAAMLAAGCTVSGSHAAAVARPPVVPGLDSSGPGLTGAQLPAAVVPNVSGPVSRPDLRLTPGAIATSDTAAVCLQSRRLRSPEIPPASQAAVYLEYGDTTTARQHEYRIDYLVPLDRLANVSLAVTLVAGLLILAAVAALQLRAVLRARYPGVRAAVALAATVPLFLLLFASAYYVMARSTPGSFSQHLTRTDALYFTVTTFTTVGFGDITATSQTARLVVTVQMILDLLALGLGIRVFIGAVKRAREAQSE